MNCRLLILAILMVHQLCSFAQGRARYIGLHENITDYNVVLLDGKWFAFDSSLSHTTRLSYTDLLNRNWMWTAGVSAGFIQQHTYEQHRFDKSFVYGADAMLMLRLDNGWLFAEDGKMQPYLGFGYRLDRLDALEALGESPYLLHNQYAVGSNVVLLDNLSVQLQMAIDQLLVGDFNTHIQYRLGLIQRIGAANSTAIGLVDSDKDGVYDHEDRCPLVYGDAAWGGCPPEQRERNDSLRMEVEAMELLVIEQEMLIDSLQDELTDLWPQEQEVLATSSRKPEDRPEDTPKPELSQEDSTLAPDRIDEDIKPAGNRDRNQGTRVAETSTARSSETAPSRVPIEPLAMDAAPKGFYVVVISVKEKDLATQYQAQLLQHHPQTYILLQPNGFFRVGVYSGERLQGAKDLRQQLLNEGHEAVWIARQ